MENKSIKEFIELMSGFFTNEEMKKEVFTKEEIVSILSTSAGFYLKRLELKLKKSGLAEEHITKLMNSYRITIDDFLMVTYAIIQAIDKDDANSLVKTCKSAINKTIKVTNSMFNTSYKTIDDDSSSQSFTSPSQQQSTNSSFTSQPQKDVDTQYQSNPNSSSTNVDNDEKLKQKLEELLNININNKDA